MSKPKNPRILYADYRINEFVICNIDDNINIFI